ncbi:uncharacterized protein LOC134698773 [Mytilus trossulus]
MSVQNDLYNLLALDEENTRVVAKLPDRPNVFIHVEQQPCSQNHEIQLQWIINMVSELQSTTPKTIVYCQNLRQCETLYIWLMEELESLAYLNGVVNIKNRMIEMYHSRTDESSMHRILSDFKNSESTIKIIFATVAFGLGIDIPNISIVVCWGVSSSAMTFWQELGRCARNGSDGYTYTYPYARSLSLCSDKKMKDLIKEKGCLRNHILSLFILDGMDEDLPTSSACDVNECDVCKCQMCRCCSNCKMKCCCKGKDLVNHLTKYHTTS